MIERYNNKIEMLCEEECGESLGVYPAEDFDVMIDDAKRKGWTIRRQGKEWIHICPDCA